MAGLWNSCFKHYSCWDDVYTRMYILGKVVVSCTLYIVFNRSIKSRLLSLFFIGLLSSGLGVVYADTVTSTLGKAVGCFTFYGDC